MPVSYQPYPVPTPYQSPAQGGNPYVTPGTIGEAIPASATPNINQSYVNQSTPVKWSTGQVTPAAAVNTQAYTAPQPTQTPVQNSSPVPTPNASVDLSNPVKKNDYAKAHGYDTWDQYQNSLKNGGGNKAVDLSNPVKKTDYAQSKGFPTWEAYQSSFSVPAGPTDAQLNNAYNPIFDYLNQAKSGLQDAYNRQVGLYGTQEANRQKELQSGLQQSNTALKTQKGKAFQRKEDVITAARRMYNELAMANKQRFGGSTSAGQAASELQSVEWQRSQASTQKAFEQTMREIGNRETEVSSQYQLSLNKIKEQTDAARQQAYSDLQNGLLEISRQRATTEAEKSQRKLNYLDQYRQQLFQVKLAEQQFNQQLQAWKQQQDYGLGIYKQQLAAQQQYAQKATGSLINNTTLKPSTALVPGDTTNQQIPTYTGYMKNDKLLKGFAPGLYDKNGQQIGSSAQPYLAY